MTYEEILQRLQNIYAQLLRLGQDSPLSLLDGKQDICLEIIKLENDVQRAINTMDDLK